MPIVRISSRYRFTVPKGIRAKLGIKPGQRFAISERNGTILLTPVPDDPIEYLHGIFKGGPSTAKELLAERAGTLSTRDKSEFPRGDPAKNG